MQRIPRILVIALALGLAGVTPVQPSISIRLTRASFDLLDSIGIVVSVRNSTKVPQPVRFAHAAEYAIDVRHGADLVWTSQPTVSPAPRETTPPHTRDFPAGVTTIATFDWNELDANGMSPAPGIYTIQARLLDHAGNADAVQSIRFVEPLPLAAIAKLKVGDEVTVAGTVDSSMQMLSDGTATLALSKRLMEATGARLAVRGSIGTRPDGTRYLAVERWAPLAPRDQDASRSRL